MLSKYAQEGEDELSEAMLAPLLTLLYHALADAIETLGDVEEIRTTFFDLQKHLYTKRDLIKK